ncbi:MAG: oligosaccharide flippase family protein [Lachnospiraceae bacterium]|nr:oligosaccharide flippase family protein [Lachnospiraceae bacterium]
MKNNITKLLKKYSNLSSAVRASVWFTICNILQKGISMITVPIFTRILTEEQFGVYSVYQSWYQIIFVFATLNLSNGVFNNGMIKYEDEKEQFISSMQGLTTSITLVLMTIYLCYTNFWNQIFELSTILVIAMFIDFLVTPALLFWSARQRFEFKYKKLVAVTLIMAAGSPILGIVTVLCTQYKAEARILSFAVVQILFGLIFYVYNYYKGKCFFNKKFWKFALAFNIPLIPHYLSQSVLQQSDRIMINSMVGTDKAAIYSVAYSISTMMILVTAAINNSFIPYTYRKMKEKKYNDIGKNANILIVIVGICMFLVIAFGPEVVSIFAPPSYYEAIWIIPPVSISVYFMFLYPLFGNIEFYFEENKYVAMASVTGAIVNVVLNYIFIPVFGYIAAGYTTLFCYILFSAGHYIFMKKVIKKHIEGTKIYDMRFVCLFSVGMLIGMIIMLSFYEFTIIRYIVILVLFLFIIIKRKYLLGAIKNMKG